MMELLVTLAVTVFGIMGVMALHASLTRGADSAGRTQEAVAVGTETMETLRALRPTDMMKELTGSTTSVPPQDIADYSTVIGRNGISYTVDVHVTMLSASSNLWRLRLEVRWTDDNSDVEHNIPFEVIRTTMEAL